MIQAKPVEWHTNKGADAEDEAYCFLKVNFEDFKTHLLSHTNFYKKGQRDEYFYDLEELCIKFGSQIKRFQIPTIKTSEITQSYNKELNIQESYLSNLLYALSLGFELECNDLSEEFYFDRTPAIFPKGGYDDGHGSSLFSIFPPFLPFIPEGGFPYFGLKVLEEAKNYFMKAGENYNSILEDYRKCENYDNIILKVHHMDYLSDTEADTIGDERSRLIVNVGGGIKNLDLEVSIELDKWKSACDNAGYPRKNYTSRDFLI